mgnify:CR=1 FL=1
MRMLNESLFRELARHEAPLCLSLFLELSAGGGDHKQIRGALKGARSEATEALRSVQAADDAVAAVRERLEALDYADLAGGHDRRVAVFIAPDLTEVVDARFDETGVHAGAWFRLAALLGDLEHTKDHAVLAASQEGATLYLSSGGALAEEKVADMPASLADISRFTDQQEKGNIHGREDSGIPGSYKGAQATATGTSGPQGVSHHSVGGHDWREDKEHDLRSYANMLIDTAGRHLAGSNTPLVIAADARLQGMIRENNEYPFLAAEGVVLHPRELDEEDLRQAAAACLERQAAKARDDAWDKVAMSLGRQDREASDNPVDIVTASAAGQVVHLFIRAGATLHGRVNDETLETEIIEDGPESLVDRAISETLRNDGDVFALDSRGSDSVTMAAAFRYPA